VGHIPLYIPFVPTYLRLLGSIQAPFITLFSPMISRLPHLHNSTLKFSFHFGPSGTPFDRPKPRYIPPIHIYLLCSCYIHVLILQICFTSGIWFECTGLHPRNLFTLSAIKSFESSRYISLTGIPFNRLLTVAFYNHSP